MPVSTPIERFSVENALEQSAKGAGMKDAKFQFLATAS